MKTMDYAISFNISTTGFVEVEEGDEEDITETEVTFD